MDLIDSLLRALGAFYVFAGVVGTRAGLTARFIDIAIGAISGGSPSRAETMRSSWLLAATSLVFAGGATLLFLLDAALWAFLASLLGQAAYLYWVAPRYLDKDDPPDAAGRQQTTNAFMIYLVATALVVWAASAGRLHQSSETPWPVLAVVGGAIALQIGYVVWHLVHQPAARKENGAAARPRPLSSESKRIKVMAEVGTYPVWSLDEEIAGDFSPFELPISDDLAQDLEEWGHAYVASVDPEKPDQSSWSEVEEKAHEDAGYALALRLARELPDRTIYAYRTGLGLVEVRADGPA